MRKLPKSLNREEITRLIDSIDEPWLMVAILFGLFCGLRLGEILRLKVQDIDLVSKRVRVENSKNPNRTIEGYGKDRVVPIPQCFARVVKTYLELMGNDATYLFPSLKYPDMPMAKGHLWRAYKQALQRANLNRIAKTDQRGMNRYQFNFHTLRHTYATILWEKTGDILTVKQALGHAKIETTMIYTHATNKVVQERVNQAFEHKTPTISGNLDPLAILTRRLVTGEIDMNTFKRLRQELRNTNENVYIG